MAVPGQNHDWQQAFLDALREMGVVRYAAEAAGVNYSTVYRRIHSDPEFKVAFEAAREEAVQAMEMEGRRRAVQGTTKPVYQGGKLVGHIQEYSDVLLMFFLKAARPEVYRETIRVDIRREAERMAEALGMDAEDIAAAVEEAERILRDAGTASPEGRA